MPELERTLKVEARDDGDDVATSSLPQNSDRTLKRMQICTRRSLHSVKVGGSKIQLDRLLSHQASDSWLPTPQTHRNLQLACQSWCGLCPKGAWWCLFVNVHTIEPLAVVQKVTHQTPVRGQPRPDDKAVDHEELQQPTRAREVSGCRLT